MMTRVALATALLLSPAYGHVGSPDVFFEGKAGAYPLSIVIRPPLVIPGVAQVEIRAVSPGIHAIHVVPYPLTGVASKYAPTPETAERSIQDHSFYTSAIWLMAFGSYQVRIDVEGSAGKGTLAVPIPSVARSTKALEPNLGLPLGAMMLFIFLGAVSIVGAAAREATLSAAESPGLRDLVRSRKAMVGAGLGFAGVLALAGWWWSTEADSYRQNVYRQPVMAVAVANGTLSLRGNFGKLLPDHGHDMHLFVIRMPEMDRMWHLHPARKEDGSFAGPVSSLPAGRYRLFADIVHETGFPETPVGELTLQHAIQGQPLLPDDAEGTAPPWSQFDTGRTVAPLRDGFHILRTGPGGTVLENQMYRFTFSVRDGNGIPASDLEPYLGMAGHAEIVNGDASTFAHLHPSGTVAMPALELTQLPMKAMGHGMPVSPELSFPYGFPKPGRYRMFLQIQRRGMPQTASFDFDVKAKK